MSFSMIVISFLLIQLLLKARRLGKMKYWISISYQYIFTVIITCTCSLSEYNFIYKNYNYVRFAKLKASLIQTRKCGCMLEFNLIWISHPLHTIQLLYIVN